MFSATTIRLGRRRRRDCASPCEAPLVNTFLSDRRNWNIYGLLLKRFVRGLGDVYGRGPAFPCDRRPDEASGGGSLITDYALLLQTRYKNTIWEISAQRVKDELMCFKKPLKSDSEKSERPIHNTKYQVQSKDKALKDPAAPPRRATTRLKVVDNEGGGKLRIKTRQMRINEDIKPAEVSCCWCVRCSYSTLDPGSPQIHENTEDCLWGGVVCCETQLKLRTFY